MSHQDKYSRGYGNLSAVKLAFLSFSQTNFNFAEQIFKNLNLNLNESRRFIRMIHELDITMTLIYFAAGCKHSLKQRTRDMWPANSLMLMFRKLALRQNKLTLELLMEANYIINSFDKPKCVWWIMQNVPTEWYFGHIMNHLLNKPFRENNCVLA